MSHAAAYYYNLKSFSDSLRLTSEASGYSVQQIADLPTTLREDVAVFLTNDVRMQPKQAPVHLLLCVAHIQLLYAHHTSIIYLVSLSFSVSPSSIYTYVPNVMHRTFYKLSCASCACGTPTTCHRFLTAAVSLAASLQRSDATWPLACIPWCFPPGRSSSTRARRRGLYCSCSKARTLVGRLIV